MVRAKWAYADVKKFFETEGYILLETEYVNNKTKMSYICPQGHESSISWHSFKSGQRCRFCYGRVKKTLKQVKNAFKDKGFTLLSDEYINSNTKLDYKCSKGHINSATLGNINSGWGCPDCSGCKKLTIEFIKKECEELGWCVLDTVYIGNRVPLKVRCPSGHISERRWSDIKRYSCLECSGKKKKTIEEVSSFIRIKGYNLLSKIYKNSREKLKIQCPNKHIFDMCWHDFANTGYRCAVCSRKKKKTIEEVQLSFSKVNYQLLTGVYINAFGPLEYICNKGHKHTTAWNKFQCGYRCPTCWAQSTTSKAELEILEFVKEVYSGKVMSSDREVLAGKELDIYIPEKNLAIEYCGLYWHSEISGGKENKYHYNKMVDCREKGIRLITIFEDEYIRFPEVVKSRIRNALGCIVKRVYARKCQFVEIDTKDARSFLDKFHLQGYSPCKYKFGLVYEGELIQVMTFGSLSRAHAATGNMLEMKRLASSTNIIISGGAEKLFKNAIKVLDIDSIKSYCDMRWSSLVPVYEKLGFYLKGYTKYTPHYIKDYNIRIRNQLLRKTPEERLTGKTEWELRREQGYDRIWDCGHNTYIYNIK